MARDRPPRAADARPDATDDADESRLFTYGLPFLAALFLSLGILGTVYGGWAIVQPALGSCGEVEIGVWPPASAAERADAGETDLERLSLDQLSPAERAAVEAAVVDPQRRAVVEGGLTNREAFDRGLLVEREGETWYATTVAQNRCLAVDPLALPLGLFALLVGVGAFTLVAVENYPWEFRWPGADGEPRKPARARERAGDEERAETDVRHPDRAGEDDREQ